MSVFVSCRNTLVAVALGALGVGCGPEGLPSAAPRGAFSGSTPGWNLVGNTFGTNKSDEATDLWLNPNGTVYVSGYDNGVVGFTTVDPSGDSRGLILAYSASLNTLTRTIKFGEANGKTEVVEALTVGPGLMELYFTGRTTGALGTTPNISGQFDTFAGWTDFTGTTKKIFQFGNERPQHPRRLALDNAGGMIISGWDDLYVPSNYVEAWEDPFVLKLRRSGNDLTQVPGWPLQFNTAYTDLLPGMAMKSEENAPIYITGASLSGTGRGMFVKKFKADGTADWHSQQSPISVDMGAALHVRPDGNVLFVGSTYMDYGVGTYGEMDVVVRLLDPVSGQPIWTRTYGTPYSEWVTDVTVDDLGNIYVVGQTYGSFDPNILPPEYDSDIFLIKLAPDGTSPQFFQVGSWGEDYPAAVAVNGDGDVFVAGYSTDSFIPGKSPKGGRDGFVFRVSPPGMGTGAY